MQLSTNINEAKQGIEIRFDEKPAEDLTSLLSNMGFKYSYKQTMWYANDTSQRRDFVKELERVLAEHGDLGTIEIKPAFGPTYENIERRNFSCVTIDCLEGEESGVIQKELLLFDPSTRAARELAYRFAKATFGDRLIKVTVSPRNQKKKARTLFENGQILYSSLPENNSGKVPGEIAGNSIARPEPEVISLQGIDLSKDVDAAVLSLPEVETPEQAKNVLDESFEEDPEPEKRSDEEILKELFQMKRTANLTRTMLKDLGIQQPLTGWEIPVGDYRLVRTSVFRFTYKLIRIPS